MKQARRRAGARKPVELWTLCGCCPYGRTTARAPAPPLALWTWSRYFRCNYSMDAGEEGASSHQCSESLPSVKKQGEPPPSNARHRKVIYKLAEAEYLVVSFTWVRLTT